MFLVCISLFVLLAVQSRSTAIETCRYHLQKAASKFCPNTTCVEATAVELAVELSDSLFVLFYNLDDFCCRRICSESDLRQLCCEPVIKKLL